MMKNKERTIGLYIHIPFCQKKCNYCDFLSFPMGEKERKRYIDALVCEMELMKQKVSAYVADTIFIGGGTPSLLSQEEIDAVFCGIHDNFSLSPDVEFSIECNPGTAGSPYSFYRQAGVNRISFGMQSAVDTELKGLGRIHCFADFTHCYEQARKQGFENINIDIMSAIPGQTVKSYETTLQKVVALQPEHISSYSLIIEEGTPFYEKYAENPPVDEDTDRRMYEQTESILAKAGYERYEISNYAKEGRACRHNMKYWRRGEYLGLGLGAASFMENCRFSDSRDLTHYCEQLQLDRLPVAEKEILSKEDAQAEFMYLGLRCMQGVSRKDFYHCFRESMESCFGDVLERCEKQGLLLCEGEYVRLTKRGIDVSNRVFAEFI